MIMAVSPRSMLLGVLVFALTACGGQVNTDREVAQTPQTAQSPQSRFPEQPAPESDTRPVIAAFGDSISAGYGVAPGKTYPEDLQHLLDAAGYHYRVENLGVSGDTTTDGVERLPGILALHPAIVILEFGGNDGLRGLPVASARMNLAKMIEELRAANMRNIAGGNDLTPKLRTGLHQIVRPDVRGSCEGIQAGADSVSAGWRGRPPGSDAAGRNSSDRRRGPHCGEYRNAVPATFITPIIKSDFSFCNPAHSPLDWKSENGCFP